MNRDRAITEEYTFDPTELMASLEAAELERITTELELTTRLLKGFVEGDL